MTNQEMFDARQPLPRHRRKKKPIFWIVLGVYVAVALSAVAAFIGFFYGYIGEYETSRPERAVEDYIAAHDNAYWQGLVETYYRGATSPFENGDDVLAMIDFDAILAGEKTFYQRAGEYTVDNPVYTVVSGKTEIAKLSLVRSGKTARGFDLWQVSEVSGAAGAVPTVSVTVLAPTDATLQVNGRPVSDDYVTKERVDYPLSGVFESHLDTIPYRREYTVSGLFDTPDVKLYGADGAAILPVSYENGFYEYDTAPAGTAVVSVTVPEGATVQINGVTLSDEYLEETGLVHPLSEGVNGFYGTAPTRVRYRVEGLYIVPEVAATGKNGTPLRLETSPKDGNYVYSLEGSDALKAQHKAVAEQFVREYFTFTAKGQRVKEEDFAILNELLLPYGQAHTYLRSFMSSLRWNDIYYVTYNTPIDTYNFYAYADGCFSCRAAYDVTFSIGPYVKEYDGYFDLVFVKSRVTVPGEDGAPDTTKDVWLLSKLVLGEAFEE